MPVDSTKDANVTSKKVGNCELESGTGTTRNNLNNAAYLPAFLGIIKQSDVHNVAPPNLAYECHSAMAEKILQKYKFSCFGLEKGV
jgi:hypothetical protein